MTLFTGLTLTAGTYYLVIGSAGPYVAGGWHDALPNPTIVLGAGVTRNGDYLANNLSTYTPASVFRQNAGINGDPFLQYSVATIPEPATFVMLGGGLLVLACAFATRRAGHSFSVAGHSRFRCVTYATTAHFRRFRSTGLLPNCRQPGFL